MIAMMKLKVTLHIIQGMHICVISRDVIAMDNIL